VDKRLLAQAMAVGGVQHWDPFAKQLRVSEGEIKSRESSWSLFFFPFYFISFCMITVPYQGKKKQR